MFKENKCNGSEWRFSNRYFKWACMANTFALVPGILMLHSIHLILHSRLPAFVRVPCNSIPCGQAVCHHQQCLCQQPQ